MAFEGFAIVPPISPWDEKHREEIEMDLARRTIGATPGEAWARQCRRGIDNIGHQDFGQRVQFWHERGYRLKRVRVELLPEPPHQAKGIETGEIKPNGLHLANATKNDYGG